MGTKLASEYRYGWFTYDKDTYTIPDLVRQYKSAYFRPMNKFIAINTYGDIFATLTYASNSDDTNPLILCVDGVVKVIFDSNNKAPITIISKIMKNYITGSGGLRKCINIIEI